MITTGILYLVYFLVAALFSPLLLLSDVSLNTNIGASLAAIGSYISIVDAFFPIATLLAAFISVHLVVEGYIFTYKLIMWIVRRFPTQS